MKAIIFDTHTSTLSLAREIQLLKVCYLIADNLRVGGQVAANISFERNCMKFSINKKMHYILEQLMRRDFPDRDLYVAKVKEFMALNKKIQNLKRVPNELYIQTRKTTALYINWFDTMALEIIERHKMLGISDMNAWFDDNLLEYAVTGLCSSEERRKNDAEINAKELLELLFTKDTKGASILVFPVDLIENNYLTPEEKSDLVEKEGVPLKGVNIYHCFTIPDINALTFLELKAVRGQLNEGFAEFRGKVGGWLLYCKENDEINEQIVQLKKEVLVCESSLQEVIDNNLLLNSFDNKAKVNAQDFNFYLGIVPVTSIWKYYEAFNVLDEETLNIMKETIANSRSYPSFLPIVCISPSYRNLEKMEELIEIDKVEQFDMTRLKKSILVD